MKGTVADRTEKRATVLLQGEIDSERAGNFTAVSKDISLGGAALECERLLKEGEPIRLSLFVCVEGIEDERTPPLVVGARVQWVAEGDDGHPVCGVKFEAITDAQRTWLAKMLEVTGQ